MSLIELAFFVVLCLVLLVCIAIFFLLSLVLGEGDAPLGDVELPTVRFYRHWHELVIRCQDAKGDLINELSHSPASADEGRALLASMLSAASRAGIVLVETLGKPASETLEVWYGGQPLLGHPELRDGEQLAATLAKGGFEVSSTGDASEIRKRGKPRGKFGAAFSLAAGLLLFPFLFWQGSFRKSLAKTVLDLKGVEPEVWILALHSDRSLTVSRERNGEVELDHTVDARDLLGVAYSATLGYDRGVTRSAPGLRLVARDETLGLTAVSTHHLGRALRDMILVTAMERWEGIPATTTRPTRCPYCGTLYVLAANVTCPSCGASAGALG
jgi:hypothetical protein